MHAAPRRAARGRDRDRRHDGRARTGRRSISTPSGPARSSTRPPARWDAASRSRSAPRRPHPDRPTVAIVGDGGVPDGRPRAPDGAAEGLPFVTLVVNDSAYGILRNYQETMFGRTVAVELNAPDFAGLAAACGVRYIAADGIRGVGSCRWARRWPSSGGRHGRLARWVPGYQGRPRTGRPQGPARSPSTVAP